MAEQSSAGAAQPISCWLSKLIGLTRGTGLFVGGNSGPMHMASELGVTVVAIFADPARNGPHIARSILLLSAAGATSYSYHDCRDEALCSISVLEVLRAALRLGASNV